MSSAKDADKTLEAFKKLVPYLRGALWWVRNDLLKERQPTFNQEDWHVGHPAMSVRCRPIENRFDPIPMLMGTTGRCFRSKRKSECVKVIGLTAEEPERPTYFGSIVEPGVYAFSDLLDGVAVKEDLAISKNARDGNSFALQKTAWHKVRSMRPNWHKPTVDIGERTALNNFCMKHGI